jgi:hypothetical protein
VVVVLSMGSAVVVALTFLLFCDSGPVSTCLLEGAAVIGIALVQVLIVIQGWVLLKVRRRLRLSAALLILAIVPPVVGAVLFFGVL